MTMNDEQSFSVAIDDLQKAINSSHGVEAQMEAVGRYVKNAPVPDGVFGPSDTAAGLVKTWNEAMSQRQKELKAMDGVVNDLPDLLAKTIVAYVKGEEHTAGEIDYFGKFEDHFADQINDKFKNWSAGLPSGTGAHPNDEGGAAMPDGGEVNEDP